MNRMVDYRCETCGYTFESFFHSDPPETQPCEAVECDGTAKQYFSMPGDYRPTNAQRFDPIVIWQHNDDPSRFSFPGRSNEKPDPGYHAITITNMHEAQKWTKHINRIYSVENDMMKERDRAIFSERLKQQREDRAARIAKMGVPQLEALNRLMMERQDRKRSNKYDRKPSDVHFHIQALEQNLSNRMDWRDADTNWKARRD